ncbi:MAG: DUF1178 family protein [Burkholderiales bacterium]|jgi:hypothetical protein|nr:DUF1178 family protein [Burkholderiales bacterium]
MKVLDLHCAHFHSFEGWFSSEDDFQSQLSRQLVSCPLCGDTDIQKKLSAPRLNLSTSRVEKEPEKSTEVVVPADNPPIVPSPQEVASLDTNQLQVAWMQMVRHVVANTEDVGRKFSEEARKMHYGEAEHRNIRGHATPAETESLLEEGIQVMPLPVPEVLKGPLQ